MIISRTFTFSVACCLQLFLLPSSSRASDLLRSRNHQESSREDEISTELFSFPMSGKEAAVTSAEVDRELLIMSQRCESQVRQCRQKVGSEDIPFDKWALALDASPNSEISEDIRDLLTKAKKVDINAFAKNARKTIKSAVSVRDLQRHAQSVFEASSGGFSSAEESIEVAEGLVKSASEVLGSGLNEYSDFTLSLLSVLRKSSELETNQRTGSGRRELVIIASLIAAIIVPILISVLVIATIIIIICIPLLPICLLVGTVYWFMERLGLVGDNTRLARCRTQNAQCEYENVLHQAFPELIEFSAQVGSNAVAP